MSARSPLDEFARRFKDLAAQSPLGDIERNSRALLSHALAKMDLVTRDEFDAQARVLARTREALEELAHRVAALESRDATPD